MKKVYPKDCINSNCKKVVYVEKHELYLCLQCETCINKKKLKNEIT